MKMTDKTGEGEDQGERKVLFEPQTEAVDKFPVAHSESSVFV